MSIYNISRRAFFTGGLAMAASAGFVGLIQGRASAAPSKPRRVVLVFAKGAWDPTYTIDPKPGIEGIDGPPGELENLGGLPILTEATRPNVEAFFSAHGSMTTIINGINVASVAHPQSSHRILSGVNDDTAPDVAALAAATHGAGLAAPYLVLGRTAFSGPYAALSARTGSVNQLITLLDPLISFPVVGQQGLPLTPTSKEEALIREHVLAQATREQLGRPSKRLDDFVSSLERSDLIREIGQIGELEFSRNFEAQVSLAVEALERELCYSVQIEADGFDTHENNEQQGPLADALYGGLKTLIDELIARPGSAGGQLIDETMVIVVSEMGRTPRLNAAMGKDHWPVTSALVIGGGIDGGRVLAGTTDTLNAAGVDLNSGALDPEQNPLFYGSFVGGLLEAAGVDAAGIIQNSEPFHAIHS